MVKSLNKTQQTLRRSTRKRKIPLTYLEEFESENIKKMYLEDIPNRDISFVLSDPVEVPESTTRDEEYDPKDDCDAEADRLLDEEKDDYDDASELLYEEKGDYDSEDDATELSVSSTQE